MNASELIGYDGIFSQRLRGLMKESKVTQQELAAAVGTTRQAISQYADGSVQPNIEKLYKIAEFFHVSSDYLLGLSDTQSTNIETQAISKITGLSENSIAMLHSETEYIYDFSKKQTPQEALKYYFSKCEKWNSNIEYPKFHIINLLLADSPANLNYPPIIDILGEILEFKRQPINTKPGQQKYYGLFQNKMGSEEFDFETEEDPFFLMNHNEILDILLLQLQGTIKRYKDEHEKDSI